MAFCRVIVCVVVLGLGGMVADVGGSGEEKVRGSFTSAHARRDGVIRQYEERTDE